MVCEEDEERQVWETRKRVRRKTESDEGFISVRGCWSGFFRGSLYWVARNMEDHMDLSDWTKFLEGSDQLKLDIIW